MSDKLFYYSIKAKNENNSGFMESNWAFPPAYQDMIHASSKEEAKKIVEEKFERSFPLRVLKKNIDEHPFLLSIKEIKEDSYERRLIEEHTCLKCSRKFTLLDKYKQYQGGNIDFCSKDCKDSEKYHSEISKAELLKGMYDSTGIHNACIYRIFNKKTGKSYIGQTTQAFTFRWYQHFFHAKNTKFHKEIQSTPLPDWTFEVLEQFENIKIQKFHLDIKYKETMDNIKILNDREQYWINYYDSINNGYNTAIAKKEDD